MKGDGGRMWVDRAWYGPDTGSMGPDMDRWGIRYHVSGTGYQVSGIESQVPYTSRLPSSLNFIISLSNNMSITAVEHSAKLSTFDHVCSEEPPQLY